VTGALHQVQLRRQRRGSKSGKNSLAVEMYPNDPSKMLTLDDVDLEPAAAGQQHRLQFPIQLLVANALSVGNAHVVQSNAADLSSSKADGEGRRHQRRSTSKTGTATATITPPSGGRRSR